MDYFISEVQNILKKYINIVQIIHLLLKII